MAELEKLATTRVRKGGRQEDRVTGNLVWYATEHPETRPTKEDKCRTGTGIYILSVSTYAGTMWRANGRPVKFRPIVDLKKWFSTRFDMRLASKLADLGYEIETKYQADGKAAGNTTPGHQRHPASVLTKFSRRSLEVPRRKKKP